MQAVQAEGMGEREHVPRPDAVTLFGNNDCAQHAN
jgi:hypothetical protein